MSKFNLHTHSRYSDGTAEPREYVEQAIADGLHTLGFSEHSPLPFENNFSIKEADRDEYLKIIHELRTAFAGQIDIFMGMEIDYIPGFSSEFDKYRKNWKLDFTIGSVHLVLNESHDGLWFIDGPSSLIYDDGLTTLFQGDAVKAVSAYYQQVQEMITKEKPDIIGHLDKVRMHNKGRFFSENDPWYNSLVEETLQVIKEEGSIVEVNTRGMYKKRSDSLFPGMKVLVRIKELGIPVTISTDAHKPEEVSAYYDEAKSLLKSIGIMTLLCRSEKGWISIPI